MHRTQTNSLQDPKYNHRIPAFSIPKKLCIGEAFILVSYQQLWFTNLLNNIDRHSDCAAVG